jgi:hypothetical protein
MTRFTAALLGFLLWLSVALAIGAITLTLLNAVLYME